MIDVFLLRDEALHTLRLTVEARIGKGIQDIEICKNLAFSIADWTDRKRTMPSAVSD